MGLITPETGAIPNYLYVSYHEGIAAALKATSDAQALINSDYEFDIYINLYRPTIERLKGQFVNVLITDVSSEDATTFDKTHVVDFSVDCYVRGFDEDDPDNPGDLIPADNAAVQRLHYLAAMVEYTLTAMKNYFMGVSSDECYPYSVKTTYNAVEDASDSFTPYAPARITLTAKFPYTYADLDLPELKQVFINMQNFSQLIEP